MLETYNIPQTPPDLYPIIHTPRSLLGVPSGISIMAGTTNGGIEPIALREAFKGFIDRWQELVGASSADLSLFSADRSESVHRLTYRQSNYPYPVTGGFGEVVAVIDGSGLLKQLDDRVIPLVELPARPQIDRAAAAQKVGGRTFTYTDIAGGVQRAQVGTNEVAVRQLVVLPVEKGNVIEVYLAWEITAGTSLSWTVYVDALTGEELRTEQNFKS